MREYVRVDFRGPLAGGGQVQGGLETGSAIPRDQRKDVPLLAGSEDLTLAGRKLDAAEAERIGLVNRVVPRAHLAAAAEDLAGTIAANGPVAVRAAKEAIDRGTEAPMEQGLEIEARCYEKVLPTEDRLEALAAFAEKRRPRYSGS